ncbi:hypothetical protein E4U54_007987 [Claviceps lovelessii]|nr:hypothetical protein E4U54_007987 [Claviceps lovelessii]
MLVEDDTAPLDDDLKETIEHHGRLFQKYAGSTENDQVLTEAKREIQRLALMHAVLRVAFDNRLFQAPIAQPKRILDCGFGAGDWAIDVANQFPESEVVGIDISPHMIPDDLPDNLDLQIDDLNLSFTFPSAHFDLVHSQMMSGGINKSRWEGYVKDIFRVLRPGGWCQMTELYLNAQSSNGTLNKGKIPARVWYLRDSHISS